jgi:predicted permease
VLAIACANVAGLLASRAPARARELALRMAVGATRWRMVRQLVTESLLIATGGGLIGLVLGALVISAFRTIEYPTDIPLKLTFDLDNRALTFAILIAAGSAILSSLLPAWRASRTDLVTTLKDVANGSSERSRLWGRSSLVCAQVALSVVLLTTTSFMFRTFQSQLDQGPGFRKDGLLFAGFDPGLARYDDARANAFYRLLRDQARTLPGVTAVALASTVPMRTDNFQAVQIVPEGFQVAQGIESVSCPAALVDEGYFDTVGVRVVQGRGFLVTDTADSPPVVVVNEQFAARYWPKQNAIGKRVQIRGANARVAEVVGVAANAKYFFIAERPLEYMYLAHAQTPLSRRSLMLASSGSAEALAQPLRDLVRSIDPGMPILGLRTMEDYYDSRAVGISRLIIGTVASMGTIGVVLAMIGLYGLMAYAVSRRTREFGIRIAVGAAPVSVLSMVLKRGMVLAAVGIIIGMLGSIAVTGLLRGAFASALGVAGESWVAYAIVVSALVMITLLAAYLPARRAARIDPLRALRQE